ncbi:PREDICTED: calmodulin-like protein 8 isoform X1 [Erythranthe guttata]|uniref:calmodulin-like protein 8 isoform X1 n=1 Tax=Erythranthe guttata TaxID=4155 RepID=UPI00064D7D4D|nr:PREDICTED: calmodulin-like protein 8 isoform X1 [Erythranthe guttata]|eukprot:XP_012853888.1 PREDICTED: calmodulin-like protein 8 isoform X1 [Erythranthe guttata]
MADTLSEEQLIAVLQKAFYEFDTNGDGSLNIEELDAMMRAGFIKNRSAKALRDMFNKADSNGNGTIELDEFMNMAKGENLYVLNKEQIVEIQEAFTMFDKDGDGCITIEDLATMMRCLDQNPTQRELHDIMNEIDLNRNGTIEFDEFLDHMSKNIKESKDMSLREAFNVFDADQNGYISANEFRQGMLNLFGREITYEEAEEMIRKSDLDGDAHANFIEFVNILSTLC